jgi:hypothetical protein
MVLCTDAALREKVQLLSKMLPIFHQLQDQSVKQMIDRMDAQALGLIMTSTKEKREVEKLMTKAISHSKGGCIVWILSKEELPPLESIVPKPFNPRQILLKRCLPIPPSDAPLKIVQAHTKSGKKLDTLQSKVKTAAALRVSVANRVLKNIKDNYITVSCNETYEAGHFSQRQLLTSEYDWYANCANKDYMVDFISDLVGRAPAWHPSPRPNFSLTSEEAIKVQEEATARFLRAKEEALALCMSQKHSFGADEEIVSHGKFKQLKKVSRNKDYVENGVMTRLLQPSSRKRKQHDKQLEKSKKKKNEDDLMNQNYGPACIGWNISRPFLVGDADEVKHFEGRIIEYLSTTNRYRIQYSDGKKDCLRQGN